MSNLSRSFILFLVVVLVTALVPIFGCPSPTDGQSNLTSRVEALEAQVAALEAKLEHVSVQTGKLNGVKGPHLIIEGCNVHIRSGSGDTADSAGLTGRGNLFIGYNESRASETYGRLGSHNLVVGQYHEYSSYGGFVAGEYNTVAGAGASVSGGNQNYAVDSCSSVSGGRINTALSFGSSVSGGYGCTAGGVDASVSGGSGRTAPGGSDWAGGALFQDF